MSIIITIAADIKGPLHAIEHLFTGAEAEVAGTDAAVVADVTEAKADVAGLKLKLKRLWP
jgi:hypothetical protein